MQDLKHCKPSTEPSFWVQFGEGIILLVFFMLASFALALANA